jgi:Ca2+-transporting ATPase
MVWHAKDVEEVLKMLGSNRNGLRSEEVAIRIKQYGYNEVAARKRSPILMFLRQFTNFLVVVLIIATVIAAVLGEIIDAAAIAFIVMLMGVMGFAQEYRAERALEKLKELATPMAKVIRDGKLKVVSTKEIVPGDIIVLSEGDKVPADARLIEAEDLEVDESSLTGESEPVGKYAEKILPEDTELAERRNMVFMGTHVVKGKGLAVVVATGMDTELGKIAAELGEVKEERTLLERELDHLGKRIGIAVLAISAVIFFTTYFINRYQIIDAFILAIALAVAAIPEGLPAVTTTVLAVGAWRMAKKKVLVRKLGAIEALGACNVIASDKTGTITKGEMTVKRVWIAGSEYDVGGSGYEPKGEIISKGSRDYDVVGELSKYIVLHVAGDVVLDNEEGRWVVRGSPTEGAALVFALKVLGLEAVNTDRKLVKTIPFDRFRKRKTTIHGIEGKYLVVSSGAPELLLERCSSIRDGDKVVPLDDGLRSKLLNYIDSLAAQGFRTFGIAYRIVDELPDLRDVDAIESDLIMLAIAGIIDPPREGVKEAVELVRKAGIKVMMVTGDHKLTAMAVGKMIGLDIDHGIVLEGKELDKMSDEELDKLIDKITVFARVTPQHKARIVESLKRKGYVVAMTGDGINDAPALKKADIGIAMGIRGTDVTKEVAQIIIQDDNFVTIVEAVKEGRIIYENLKKPINYLLPANMGEVATIFASQLAGLPPALTATQLLWINVTTDSLPALALSVEPPEPKIMEKPPRGRKEKFITNRKLAYFVILGALIGGVNLGIFSYLIRLFGEVVGRTAVFAALAFSEFGRALSSRSERVNFWKLPWNKWLLPAMAASAILQLAAIYTPLNMVFSAVPLPVHILPITLATAVVILAFDELRKLMKIVI